MGKFSLENRIRERLKGHEVPIDKGELWKSLGIEDDDKDRKLIWFWWTGGAMVLLLVVGAIWLLNKDENGAVLVESETKLEVAEHLAKTGNERIEKEITTKRLGEIINEVETEVNERPDSKNLTTNEDNNVNREEETIVNTQYENSSNAAVDKTIVENTEEQELTSMISEINEKKSEDLITTDISLRTPLSSISLLTERINLLEYKRDFILPAIDKSMVIKPLPLPRKFEIGLLGGVGYIDRSLNSTVENMDAYIAKRDSVESLLEHVSLGVTLRYNLTSGIYLRTGVMVNRWNEKYQYSEASDTILSVGQVPDVIIVDLDGNITTEYVEGEITTINNSVWTRYNRLTQIDVPLTLGYEHRMDQWSIFGEATMLVNLRQSFFGYLNTGNSIIVKDPDIFKSNIGLNMGFGAGIGYGITPRLRVRMSAQYYRSLDSVLNPEHGIEQRYSSYGLRVGIGYLF